MAVEEGIVIIRILIFAKKFKKIEIGSNFFPSFSVSESSEFLSDWSRISSKSGKSVQIYFR